MGDTVNVYVDTNVVSDLFREREPWEDEVRSALRRAAADGQAEFLTSMWTLQELCGIAEHDWPKFERVLAYVLELVGGRVMPDAGELVQRELVYGRRLRGRERLISADTLEELQHELRQDSVLAIYQEARAKAGASASEWRRVREEAWRKLESIAEGRDPRRAVHDWWADASRWIDEWSRDALPDRMRRAGFDDAAATRYPLHLVPTLPNVIAEVLARIVWNAGRGEAIRPSDDADTQHYAAACYADVFVSGDGDLRQIIELIPAAARPPITLLTFVETIGVTVRPSLATMSASP